MTMRLDTSVLDAMTADMPAKATKIVRETALSVQGLAVVNAPFLTGFLRGTIAAIDKGNITFWVEDATEYGIFQELGTRKMPAHPFMVPAVENERSRFDARFAELFR